MSGTGVAAGAGLSAGLSSLYDRLYPDASRSSLSQNSYSRLYAKKLIDVLPEQLWQSSLRSVLSSLNKKTEELVTRLDSFVFPAEDDPESFVLARVSDPDKVRATALSGASPAYHLLEISSLSSVQENHSKQLVQDEAISFTAGDYVVQANVQGQSSTLSFTLDSSQARALNNMQWLTALSLLFNNAFSGIKSDVTRGQEKVYSELSDQLYNDVVSLQTTGEQAGSEHWFILSDQEQSLLADLGLNLVVQGAEQTRYRLDGLWQEGTDTGLSLDNGKLVLEFLEQTVEPVVIEVKTGREPVLSGIQSLVEGFNDYLDWVRGKYLYIDQSMLDPLTGLVKDRKLQLEDLGLEVDDQNKKLFPGNELGRSLESRAEDVRSVLFAEDGFFPRVRSVLGDILAAGVERYGLNRSLLLAYNQYGQESLLYPQSKPESGFDLLA